MTNEIRLALETVRKFHPQVTTVVFNQYGQWNYCDDNFDSPTFDDDIDQGILEDASDSVKTLPCVFCIETVETHLSNIANLFDLVQTSIDEDNPKFTEKVELIRCSIEDLKEDIGEE